MAMPSGCFRVCPFGGLGRMFKEQLFGSFAFWMPRPAWGTCEFRPATGWSFYVETEQVSTAFG